MKKACILLISIMSCFICIDCVSAYSQMGTNTFDSYKEQKNIPKFNFYNSVYTQNPLEDGTYVFASAINGGLVMDVNGGKTANCTNVHLYSSNDTYAQYWDVKYLGDGYYSITSALNNKKSLDVMNANKNNGANVQLYDSNESDAQKWIIRDAGNGYYTIISKLNGFALDVQNGKAFNTANIQMYEANGTLAQKFKAIPIKLNIIEDGTYTIHSKLELSKVLDLNRGLPFNNTNVQIESNKNSNLQKWDINYLGGGYYSIRPALDTTQSLDVDNLGQKSGTNIKTYKYSGNSAQQWMIKDAGNGYYTIVSRYNNLALDVANASSSDGTNIQMYTSNGTDAQKFMLKSTKVVEENNDLLEDGVYTFSSALNENKVLDTSGSTSGNSTNVLLNTYTGFASQLWDVKNLGNGYYSIINYLDEVSSLDVDNFGPNPGTNIQLYKYNGNVAQQWIIKDAGEGYFNIISRCNGLLMDVDDAKTADGTNIQMYTITKSDAQKFKATKVDLRGIEDGTYRITSQNDPNKVLGLNRELIYYKTGVQFEDKNDFNDQIWNIKRDNDGYYSITSAIDSNKALDVVSASKSVGAELQVYEANGTDAQRWFIKSNADGSYNIFNKNNGLSLGTLDLSKKPANVQTFKNDDTKNQKFVFEESKINDDDNTLIDSGTYNIVSALDNKKALDVAGLNGINNANIHLYDLNGLHSQKWNVEKLEDGTYSIISALNSTQSLDVDNIGMNPGTNIQLYKYNGNTAQRWIIKPVGNEEYIIVSVCNGLVLDVNGEQTFNGTNIQMNNSLGIVGQKFKFIPTDDEQGLPDGLYTINSKLEESKVLGLNREIALNGTNVQLETENNMNDQKWYVKYLGGGIYSIKSALNSIQSLDVNGSSILPGANVQIYMSNDTPAQRWFIKDNGDGTYSIIAQNNGLYVDVDNANTADGTNIKMYTNTGSNAQKFVFKETDINTNIRSIKDGYYTISNSSENKSVLDVANASKKDGNNIQLYSYNGSNAQVWYFKYSKDGYYTISSALNNKKVLDVANAGMNSGSNVQLYTANGTDAQKWLIKDAGENGYISIISKLNGYVLDIDGGNLSNGTNIQVAESKNTANQKFSLNPFSGKKEYKGIDISHYNNVYDWNSVSKNVDFAILKAGEGNDPNYDDSTFINYARNCVANNISYGIYWFAFNTTEYAARLEADNAARRLNELRQNGIMLPNLSTQVFYDVEAPSKGGGIANLDKDSVTNIIKAFCGRIKEHGYTCGVYANTSWLNNKIHAADLEKNYNYPIWAAQYFNMAHPTFSDARWRVPKNIDGSNYTASGYKYWQFASDGIIPGISGNVDVNLGYDIFD